MTPFSTALEPHIKPRNLADALNLAAFTLVQAPVLLSPGLLVWSLTDSFRIGLKVAMVTTFVLYLFRIKRTTFDETGIHFERTLGRPKAIAWSQITAVHEVTPKELIVHGWLWPFAPPREVTTSMTTIGHNRIQFGDRWIYFPPKDPQLFLAIVEARAVQLPRSNANTPATSS